MVEHSKDLRTRCYAFVSEQSAGEWDDKTIIADTEKLMAFVQDEASPTSARIAALEGALRGMVLVCGRTGNSFEDFEDQAEAFRRETGLMRPGKDMPMDSSGDDSYDMRRLQYYEWVQRKLDAGRAALSEEG